MSPTVFYLLALVVVALLVGLVAYQVKKTPASSEEHLVRTHRLDVPESTHIDVQAELVNLMMKVDATYCYLGWDDTLDKWGLSLEVDGKRDIYYGTTQTECVLRAEKALVG